MTALEKPLINCAAMQYRSVEASISVEGPDREMMDLLQVIGSISADR